MASNPWQRIKEILDEALELPAEERGAFVEQACGGDAALRAEVESLLRAEAEASGFMEKGVEGLAGALLEQRREEGTAVPDEHVGPYRLVRELGRGGMGVVYLADRADGQYEQRVALKLLPRHFETAERIARFRAERQILAALDHPNIARLVDGGLTTKGRPYLVMEHVDGVPITQYCAERACFLKARIRLLQAVGRAVQFAHRNLVVHRDLKPSNILITEDGTPKLLDFGIAKLLDEEALPVTRPRTRTGEHLMTPEYAAPEQIRGEAITAATDVYQLGVLAYEVLTGRRPFRFKGRSLSEIEQAVLETQPAKPSTAVTRSAPEAGEQKPPLPARVGEWSRRLHGDLDTIVMKALRKEPEHRYASARALVEDLQRYLDGHPVEARPATAIYRLRKFTRRHRWGVGVAAVFLAFLIGAFAVVTQQRNAARQSAAQAEQVSEFLVGLFEAGNPYQARSDTVTVRALLARGVARAERLRGQPAVQARMFDVVGRAYHRLGRYEEAEKLLERSLALRRDLHGEESLETATALNHLAVTLRHRGDHERAASLYRQALAIRRAHFGEEDGTVAEILHNMAVLEHARGSYGKADSLERRSLAIREQLHSGDHRDLADGYDLLATNHRHQGRYDEAEHLQQKALSMRRRIYEGAHPDIAQSLSNLGLILNKKGEVEEAERYYREALRMERTLYEDDHPQIATTLNNLGMLFGPLGELEKAEPYLREALAMRRRLYGDDDHPDLAESLNNLAGLMMAKGDYEAALPFQKEALRIDRAMLGEAHPYVGIDLHNMGKLTWAQEATEAARRYFEEALVVYREALPTDHPRLAVTLKALGELHLQAGRYEAAEASLREALQIRRARQPEGRTERIEVQGLLGACLTSLGHYEEAEGLLQEGYEQLRDEHGGQDQRVQQATERLAALYEVWGKSSEAAFYRTRLEN